MFNIFLDACEMILETSISKTYPNIYDFEMCLYRIFMVSGGQVGAVMAIFRRFHRQFLAYYEISKIQSNAEEFHYHESNTSKS